MMEKGTVISIEDITDGNTSNSNFDFAQELTLLPGEYEVEAILGSRQINNSIEYLVKWRGYSTVWNSWEPECNLQCPTLLETFYNGTSTRTTIQRVPSLPKLDNTRKESVGELYKNLNARQPVTTSASTNVNTNNNGKAGVKKSVSFIDGVAMSTSRRSLSVKEQFLKMMNSYGGAKITLENDIDNNPPPSHFRCIAAPIVRPGVPEPDDSFIIGCECGPAGCIDGKCLCIAQNNDSLPVYSKDGRLLIESGPIYECNPKCPCAKTCTNRVVQRGRQVPLIIARYPNGKGWGVKTPKDIPQGTFIDTYLGEVISSDEGTRRFTSSLHGEGNYLFDLDFNYESGAESEFTVDAYTYGNITHFINHSCEPNLRVHPCFVESWDPRLHYLSFFAKRDINVGEELCFDYLGGQKTQRKRRRAKGTLPCSCGATKCRGYIY